MTKIICDLCGKEIKSEAERVSIHYVAATNEPEETLSERWYDIHQTHTASVVATIENLFAKEQKGVKSP